MKGSILTIFALLCVFSIALAAQSDPYLGTGNDQLLARFNYRTLYYDAPFFIPFIKPGMHIIDVGCGPGSITMGIAAQVGANGSVIGLDYDPAAIEDAIALAANLSVSNVEFIEANAMDMPFANKTFDAVFVSAVFAHVDDIKDDIMLEIVRVLKDGGFFALREPDHSRWWAWPEVPAAKAVWSYIDYTGSRNFDIGLQGKSILMHSGFEIVNHEVIVELKDAEYTLFDYMNALTYGLMLQDHVTEAQFNATKAQLEVEKVAFFAEPGRHAGFLWHGVVGQLPTNAVTPSVVLPSPSTRFSKTSAPTVAAPALRKQKRTL